MQLEDPIVAGMEDKISMWTFVPKVRMDPYVLIQYKSQERNNNVEIELWNPCREGKKLLVQDEVLIMNTGFEVRPPMLGKPGMGMLGLLVSSSQMRPGRIPAHHQQ